MPASLKPSRGTVDGELTVEDELPPDFFVIRKTQSQDGLSVKSWKSGKSSKSNKSNKSGSSYKSLPGRLSGKVFSVFRRSGSSKSLTLSDPGKKQTPPRKLVAKEIKVPSKQRRDRSKDVIPRDSQAPSLEASSESQEFEEGSILSHDEDSLLSEEEYDRQSLYGRSVHSSFDKSVDRIIDALDKVIPRSFTGEDELSLEHQEASPEESEPSVHSSEAEEEREVKGEKHRRSKKSRSSTITPKKRRKERLSTKSPEATSAVSDPTSTHSNTTDVVSNVMSEDRSKRREIFRRRRKSREPSLEGRKRNKDKKKRRSRSVSSSRSEKERRRASSRRKSKRAYRHDDRSVGTYSTTDTRETFESRGIIRTFLDFFDSLVDEYDDPQYIGNSYSFGSEGSTSLNAGHSPQRRKKLNSKAETSSQASNKSSVWERLAGTKPAHRKDAGTELFTSVSDCVSTDTVCESLLSSNNEKEKKKKGKSDPGSDAFGLESLIKMIEQSTGYNQDKTKEVLNRYRARFPEVYRRLNGDNLCGAAVVEPSNSEREGPGTRCSATYSAPQPSWPLDEEPSTPVCRNRKTIDKDLLEPAAASENQSKSSPDVVWSPSVFDETVFGKKGPETLSSFPPKINLTMKDEASEVSEFSTAEVFNFPSTPLGKSQSEPHGPSSFKRVSRSHRSFRNRSKNFLGKDSEDFFSLIPEEESVMHTDPSQWEPFVTPCHGGVDWSPSKFSQLETPQVSNGASQARELDWDLEKHTTSRAGASVSQSSASIYGDSNLDFEFFEMQQQGFGAGSTPF